MVFQSISYAQTYYWNSVNPNVSTTLTSIHSINNTLYCAGDNGVVLKSINNGNNWSNLNYPYSFHNFSGIVSYNYNNSDYLFGVATGGRFVRSTNGGVQWVYYIFDPIGLNNLSVYSDPISGTKTIWVVGNGSRIASSNNHGNSWTNRTAATSNKTFNDVFFSTNDRGVVVGSDGTINITTNNGTNWSQVTSGTTNKLNGVFFINQTTGWIVGDSGTILKTTDGGNSWQIQISNDTDDLQKVEFYDPATGVIVGKNGTILTTSDGGNAWQQSSSNTIKNLYDIRIIDQENITIVGEQGTVLTKGKQQFTLSKSVSPNEASVEGCSVSANPNQITFNAGSSVTLTAVASANWEFQEWTGNLSGNVTPQTLIMNENKYVTGVFKRKAGPKVNLISSVAPAEAAADGCTVTPAGTNQYEINSNVILDAHAGTGWVWDKWTGNLTGTSKPSTLLMDAEKNVVANFQPLLTLSLSSPTEKNLCTPTFNEEVTIATAGIFVDGVDWLLTGISFTAIEKYKPRYTEAWIEYAGSKLKGNINVDADSNATSYSFSPTQQINEGTTLSVKLILKFMYPSKSVDKYIPDALTEVKKYKVSIQVGQVTCIPIPESARPGVKGPIETFYSNRQTMASVWNVSKEPDLPFATIKEAVESSQTLDNELIKLCQGWFVENVIINKGLTIFSAAGNENTIWQSVSKKNEYGFEQDTIVSVKSSYTKLRGIQFLQSHTAILIKNQSNVLKKCEIIECIFKKNSYSINANLIDSCIVSNNELFNYAVFEKASNTIIEKNNIQSPIAFYSRGINNIIKENIFEDKGATIDINKDCDGNTITNNFFGIAQDGVTGLKQLNTAIDLSSNNNIVKDNLISNANVGIKIRGRNNAITNNIIGLDRTQKLNMNVNDAIIFADYFSSYNDEYATSNIISENVIAGCSSQAIEFEEKSYATDNIIRGNIFGTNKYGDKDLSNGLGIIIPPNTPNNTIDANTFGAHLVCIATLSNLTEITNNKFGTDPTGMNPLITLTCLTILSEHCTVTNNLFANCAGAIFIGSDPKNSESKQGKRNIITNNIFGMDITQTIPMACGVGVFIANGSQENYIENNVFGNITGSAVSIYSEGSTYNYVRENIIGSNKTLTKYFDLSNGIAIALGAERNIVYKNTICGSSQDSTRAIICINANNNMFRENYIGTNQRGTIKRPNLYGIYLFNSDNNTIVQNKIWYNKSGVYEVKSDNYISQNDIRYNTGNTGIHLDNSKSQIVGNIMANDERDAIKCEKGSNPLIIGNNIFDNKGFGLNNTDPKIKINAQGNYWGTSGLSINGNVNASNPLTSFSKLICVASMDTLFLPENGKDSVSVFYKNWSNASDKLSITISSDKPDWITSSKNIISDLSLPNSGESKIHFSLPAGTVRDEKAKVIIKAVSQTDPTLHMSDTLTAIIYKSLLNKIVIRPDSTSCSIGDTLQLSIAAFDQHSNSFPKPTDILWQANGGTITQSMKFIAGNKEGIFIITAKVNGTNIIATAKIKIGNTSTSIEGRNIEQIPTDYSLYQNYPNPFNPETTIKYDLPKKEHVILKIYDILGREVATLVNREQSPGKYEVKFNSQQKNITSGVYLYSLKAGKNIFNKKMLLVK